MRGRLALVAVLASILSVGGAGAGTDGRIVYMQTIGADQLYRIGAAGRQPSRITGSIWGSDDPTVSPDGKTLAFDSRPSGNDDILVRPLPDGPAVDLTPGTPSDDYEPAWSPHGKRIAFVSTRWQGFPELFVMNADGTHVTQLTRDRRPHELPGWSPDGSTITFDTSTHKVNGDIWAIGADGTGLRRYTGSRRDEWGARWSPDGRWIAFVTEVGKHGHIFLMRPGGADAHALRTRQPEDDLGYPTWSRDGKRVGYADLIGDCGVYTISLDGSRRRLFSPACASTTTEADYYNLSWAPDGSFWFSDAPIGAQDLATVGAQGGAASTLTKTDDTVEAQPAWSPDGSTIAYMSDAIGSNDIWLMRADGSNRRDITRGEKSDDQEPAWSPDGTQLAFATDRGAHGHVEVYLMNSDGSHQRPLSTLPGDNFEPAWAPDGTRVAFANAYDKQVSLYVSGSDGLGLVRLGLGEAPSWSPDGATIAYLRQGEIWRMNADGSGARALTVGKAPSWSPDGSQILFQRTVTLDRKGNKRDEIWVMDANGGGLREVVVACDDALADDFAGDCGDSATPDWTR